MRKILLFLIAVFLLFACSEKSNRTDTHVLIDDLHHTVNVELPVRKAVSLAPNLTEIIYFINAENSLAANTLYCDFPPEAKNKPKIGDLMNIDYESLVKINPDIVLMTTEGNNKGQYNKIKSLGLNIFVSDLKNFDDILKTISVYGKIFGKEKAAIRKIQLLKAEFDSLRNSVNKRLKKSAIFLISIRPLIAAGSSTFINEYLTVCGLSNTIGKTNVGSYPIINIEELIKENPDLIILPQSVKKYFDELVNQNAVLRKIKAIRNGDVVYVNPDLYFRPGPRFIEALKDFLDKVNGGNFSE